MSPPFVQGIAYDLSFFVILLGLVLFLFDLFGFALFALGLFQISKTNTNDPRKYSVAAWWIVAWGITRSIFQLLIFNWYISDIYSFESHISEIFLWFALSSLFLLLSGLSQIDTKYLYFCVLNFFTVYLAVCADLLEIPRLMPDIVISLKLLAVPLFGIYAFGSIYFNDLQILITDNISIEIYPEVSELHDIGN